MVDCLTVTKGLGWVFEPHHHHCVVSLSKTHFKSPCLALVHPRKTGLGITEKLLNAKYISGAMKKLMQPEN